jgi:hypothetical protein
MATCEVCGNEYDRAFQVHFQGTIHVFDSFECAAQALAPKCEQCGCRILGHGVQEAQRIFCCAHCARQAGVRGLKDRKDSGQS